MSDEDKLFDEAFDAVSEGKEVTIDGVEPVDSEEVKTDGDGEAASEQSDNEPSKPADSESEPVGESSETDKEIKRLQETVMRQAAAQSALQKELNKAKVVKPKQFAPVLDEKGVFTDSFEELKKEFPEADFGRVESIITQQQEQINNLSQQVNDSFNNIQQNQAEQHLKEQTAIVMQRRPDLNLAEMVNSEEYSNWRGTLTPAELNHVDSATNADEITNIINVFEAATGYKSKATQEAESTKEAETTTEKRNKRDAGAQGLPSKQQASPVTGVNDQIDEDALFDQVFTDVLGHT